MILDTKGPGSMGKSLWDSICYEEISMRATNEIRQEIKEHAPQCYRTSNEREERSFDLHQD